jgi:hypothetical protein
MISGGLPPYQIEWLDPNGKIIGTYAEITIKQFSCRDNGNYVLRVTDAQGSVAKSVNK